MRIFRCLSLSVLLPILTVAIAGCPGSTPPPPGGVTVNGRVVLSAGVSVDGLEIFDAAGSGGVTPAGDFSVALSAPSRPSLVLVKDDAGKVVLFGFINSASDTSTVSPRDAVVALLFLGINGFTLAPEFQEALLDLIDQQPVVDTLTSTLEGLMLVNPGVLSDGDASFEAAVVAAVTELKALPGPSAKAIRENREVGPPLGSLTVFQQTQSGIDVVQAEDPGAITITNNFRRRFKVFIYKTATQNKDEAKTPVSPPEQLGDAFQVDATQNLGSVLGLFQQAIFVVTGTNTGSAFTPKTAGPIELPIDSDFDNTFFKVVTAGTGFYNEFPTTGNPELINNDAFPSSDRAEWIKTSEDFTAAAFFFDLALPALDTLAGGLISITKPDISADLQIALAVVGELQNSFNLLDANAQDVVFPGSTVVPTSFVALIAAGTWRPVADAMLKMVVKSPEARTALFSRMAVQLSPATIAFMETVGSVNTVLNLIFAGGDFISVINDIGASQNVNAWEIVVIRNRVVLTPEKPEVTSGAEIEFSVEVPSINDGQELTYEWSVSGAIGGTLSDLNHENQTSFESIHSKVKYNAPSGTNLPEGAEDVVKVKVFAVNGNVINEVGKDEATVTFTPLEVSIEPEEVTISSEELFADLLVKVEGAEPGARFLYIWQIPGTGMGVIQDSNGTVTALGTEEAAVDYVLNGRPSLEPQVDTLTVHAFSLNDDGSIRADIGTAQTEVTIEPEPCDGSDGSPVFNGCGSATSGSSSVSMGEEMTISFNQQSGGICGGTWTISMNMPGEFISAPGGTINGQSASFTDPGAATGRSATYRFSDVDSDYNGLRTCPRALGYYEMPSADTGPYIKVANGAAHDLIPYVVNP